MKRSIALGLGLAMAFLLTAPAYAAPVQAVSYTHLTLPTTPYV